MNAGFLRVIAASPEDRRGLFLATANRLGTPLQNVEKDFWVTWVLDLLFNGRDAGEPRLLFKGGTSLSKAYGLISRFSEDIDITVFREDIGQDIEVGDLEGLSGKQQRIRLDAIKQACQAYIQGALKERLNRQIEAVFREAGVALADIPVVHDPDDPDQQTLLVRYPSVSTDANEYVKPTVKIEAGAKSALDPHRSATIQPYVADDMPATDLVVPDVVTIDAERTFWDKIVILHGLRRWHDNRGALRQHGHRVSRHYYDVFKLIRSPVGQQAVSDHALALDCARHALMFFNSADLDLLHARPGSFAITPTPEMVDALKRDYQAMAGMIFGEQPDFAEVIKATRQLELAINQGDQ
ncbi:MAG: nucleotidyl transferase AbiEii/AbiGii toxin family protein [Rhodocyclales bacterium]|nr:nucleotidyl transferase AbiEii/AbiGii toxin family protein [Rhodocyclales bacterium]MBH1975851.1 nucleotidyl transferase AbiEii/AbiGii toxin family protein [Rhodocyclales bacterium]